jgi:hypothetical protein
MDDRFIFNQLARLAIEMKLITGYERDLIARKGSRKVGYWKRHLRDLKELISERLEARYGK